MTSINAMQIVSGQTMLSQCCYGYQSYCAKRQYVQCIYVYLLAKSQEILFFLKNR